MGLRRAMGYGATQTAVSMMIAFVSVKITSAFLGPSGIGLLSMLLQFSSLVVGMVTVGLNKGVIRRAAELGQDSDRRIEVVATTLKLVVSVGLPIGLTIALASAWLAEVVLNDRDMRTSLLVFSAVYPFALIGNVMLGSANGFRDYRSMAFINMTSSVFGLILFAVLCPTLGVFGGLLAGALGPLGTFLGGAWFARRGAWWPRKPIRSAVSWVTVKAVVAFVPAAAVLAIGAPLVQLMLRNDLIAHSGLASVGYLQSVTRLSDLYLGAFLTVMNMHFQPRFSEISSASEMKRELVKGMALLVPIVVILSAAIYLLRDWIIVILFTEEFNPMRELFAWQMTGNVLRGAGWLLGYVVLAKMHWLAVTAFEALILPIWWLVGTYLIESNGAIGATQAYAAAYAVYAAIGVLAFFHIHARMKRETSGPSR
jgi:O-antigen/teichoic acid export membrane protein